MAREVDVRDDEARREIDLWSQRGVDDAITKAMLPALLSDSARTAERARQWLHQNGQVGGEQREVRAAAASARQAARTMTAGMHESRVYQPEPDTRDTEDRLMAEWDKQDPHMGTDPFSGGQNTQARNRLLDQQSKPDTARQTSFVREVEDVTDGWD